VAVVTPVRIRDWTGYFGRKCSSKFAVRATPTENSIVRSAEEIIWKRKMSSGVSPRGQCSLAVEHTLSKREVVGSNPAIGFFADPVNAGLFGPIPGAAT
jgi:hypothetical protein